MKTLTTRANTSGFTLIELLVVICVIAVLAAVLLPAHSGPSRATRVVCMSHLKQIDLGFYLYAEDYGGKFPMQVSVMNGGTMEFIYSGHAFPHFEKLRKYMNESQPFTMLVCPSDKSRQAATNYEALNDMNVSYFLNADACHTNNPSQTFFAGDRNLKSNGQTVGPGLLMVATNVDLNWSGELHLRGGNLAFADGHVEWSKTNELNSVIQHQLLATNHIVVP